MLKDIAGIRFRGANFETLTDIMFLNPHENNSSKVKIVKGTLLYGRNGAGKSTLAKAIRKAKGEVLETISQAYFIDINGNPIVLSDEEKSRIFVFDEDYVDKKIKYHDTGLDTIIMLGQQVEIEEQLEDARRILNEAREAYDAQNAVVYDYENGDEDKSPKRYMKEIRWALQGDDCWSGRDKLIKGNRQNTGIRDDTYKQFISISTTKTRNQLLIDFNEKLKELRIAQQGDATILTKVPVISLEYNEESLGNLLKVKIEKPELSERERYLLELAQSGNTAQLSQMVKKFSDETVNSCPMCLQKVSREYKHDLVKSIQKVLSKAVEEHQESLKGYILHEITVDFTPFFKLSKNIQFCIDLVNQVNEAIVKNNLIIQSKIDDPYTPCEQEVEQISELLSQLKDALEDLESERLDYNSKITETKPIVDKLTEINNAIAHLDIEDHYLKYLAAEAQLKIEREKLAEKQETYNNAKIKVNELEAKQKSVEIAISVINSNLKYIFFSRERFVINYRNENYVLLSNGKAVKPSQISQGERNIIGLCYFFASILQNQEEKTAYNKEYLLVIDDPVSSFDIENKTGIMSFIKYQMGKFMLGNILSKAVIMTHDLLTFYDSEKIFEELIDASNKKFGGEKRVYRLYELKQNELINFSYDKRQEYTELIRIIYMYATGNAEEYEMVIGNIMRQVLEAFSTFQYKKGIDKVSTDQSILACLPEEEYRNYFENLMYRLILNNGSHRLVQTKAMSDLNFFTVISKDEKQRTAKEILCFIYLLNPRHLLAHLEGCDNVETNLSLWCEDIKNTLSD